ncbi:MAG TPA: peroxidase [Casimicrobiaceae bacterium]|jgi:Dyp-type peroxidase family
MTRSVVDDEDTQGLLRFGYGALTEACYVLARIRNMAAARSWLASAPIANAVEMPEAPVTAVQVAFTATGLTALGVPPSVVGGFSHEFVSGMTESSRSRRLGDVESDAPSRWAWGGDAARVPHLVAMFFAKANLLDGFMQRFMDAADWKDGFECVQCLPTSSLDDHEPFGFRDGISQPEIDWYKQYDPLGPHVDYGNRVALGEFALGYRNEYGKYTERPLIDADVASSGLLTAEDTPDRKDVGRNGTYLVMRQLRQDVRGFWQFLAGQTNGDLTEAAKLGAAMVGRTRDGEPLVTIAQHPIVGIAAREQDIRQNRFTYDGDPTGIACPIGAHIRRANPRNADYAGRPRTGLARVVANVGFGRNGFRDDLTSSVRFHRILRRGREYGDELVPEQALAPEPAHESERGLHFICLNANLSRQFEFVQNAWTMNSKFSGLTEENDAAVGNPAAIAGCPGKGRFTIPSDGGLRRRISGIPQFVDVRGGAYFFLPGLRALRYFTRVRPA